MENRNLQIYFLIAGFWLTLHTYLSKTPLRRGQSHPERKEKNPYKGKKASQACELS